MAIHFVKIYEINQWFNLTPNRLLLLANITEFILTSVVGPNIAPYIAAAKYSKCTVTKALCNKYRQLTNYESITQISTMQLDV